MHYRWFADGEERLDELGQPKMRLPIKPEDTPRKKSRAERTGLMLSAVCFAYALYVRDIPVLFVAMAFLIYEVSTFAYLLGEERGKFWGNLLRSFGIALFCGAIVMMFAM